VLDLTYVRFLGSHGSAALVELHNPTAAGGISAAGLMGVHDSVRSAVRGPR